MSDGISYVKVYTRGDGYVLISLDDEPELDATMTKYLETMTDELLSLTLLSGSTYKVRASQITSWYLCTPAEREREAEIDEALKKESGAPWEKD